MTYVDYEFEYPLKHDDHVISYVEGSSSFMVWAPHPGHNEFDYKLSEIRLIDSDTGKPFLVDLTSSLGVEISEWLIKHKSDLVEDRILESA